MLRKVLFFSLLAAATHCSGQMKYTPANKANEKAAGTPDVDYKKEGSDMPYLRLVPNYDNVPESVPNTELMLHDSLANTAHWKKYKKKHHNKYGDIHIKHVDAYTNKDFDNGANLLVMMFNPTCSHCEDQTEMFESYIQYFNKTKIIFVSTPQMRQYLPNFQKSYHTFEYPTFTVGTDSSGFVDKMFMYKALPQVNVYSADRKLIRAFCGEVSVDTLKKYIQ
jgi:protein-disulfide isomerase